MLYVMLFGTTYVLYSDVSTFHSVCAVHNKAVFCSSLTSRSPGIIIIIIIIDIIIIIIII